MIEQMIMTTPSWQPMPDTRALTIAEGAQVRSRHRARMAVRWRDKEARASDQAAGRLPKNWHSWMHCPGFDDNKERNFGYKGPGCTCNHWVKPQRKQYKYSESDEPIPFTGYVLLVKTIDMSKGVPILTPYHDARTQISMALELDARIQKPIVKNCYRRRNTRKLFTRKPTYLAGSWRTMSQLRRNGMRAR